jgi:hypothetical protein
VSSPEKSSVLGAVAQTLPRDFVRAEPEAARDPIALGPGLAAPPPNYRRAFWRSSQHAWLAILTLGMGFASGQPLGMLIGVTTYALGLIFTPDTRYFRNAADARERQQRAVAEAARKAAFAGQREGLFRALNGANRQAHANLVAICDDIEASAQSQSANRLDLATFHDKLDEILWTHLRMLTVKQALVAFLAVEGGEKLSDRMNAFDAEARALAGEVEAMSKITPRPQLLDGKRRLLTSRLERLEILKQRLAGVEFAKVNCDVVTSEQERLVEQVKLIRSDSVAATNAESLSDRLDLSIEHLATMNKWLAELADYRDSTDAPPAPGAPGA